MCVWCESERDFGVLLFCGIMWKLSGSEDAIDVLLENLRFLFSYFVNGFYRIMGMRTDEGTNENNESQGRWKASRF